MPDNFKERVTNLMVENLPVLRETLKLSQADLAEMLDISRQQVTAIENNKRKMSWSLFLALVCIFSNNTDTAVLLCVFNINSLELQDFLAVDTKDN